MTSKIHRSHFILQGSWFGAPYISNRFTVYADAFILNRLLKTGGLNFAFEKHARLLHHEYYTFKNFPPAEAFLCKSIGAILLDMNYKWKGKSLLVFNTHLCSAPTAEIDPWRTKQFAELVTFIEKTFESISLLRISLENVGVIITGDFNISAHGKQYSEIQKWLGNGLRDLFTEKYPTSSLSQSERGNYTYDCDTNSLAVDIEDNGRIDYIFSLDEFKAKKKYQFLRLRCEDINIVRQKKSQEISDHWGLEASLIPDS